ncbi:class I adenylate-forming enzyme family protein [Sulfitobacter guttiformis]|uniref:Acyl-CoA synthetase (AMP-forming)/AMP-acid ligase II n=1 Tax=Sulfitobacter guttiformis TaxID=74349 RepID=J7FXY4_9RHOB|nr:AMP-binding protein [Sulfitobacter guttiformis]AFP55460.1 long-chain-fatty-acid--CoA ligase [Sulfitobacter guttiformis]KIN75412.1 Long-chain-fatty-acid-CoA ligase [Sulfitobacter guttiformis KCTC 32187]RKE92082.1 acyl-CoA synthetase (AMP-forming)/AMP-acid ligase II [Sulfitobacter guttiformis]
MTGMTQEAAAAHVIATNPTFAVAPTVVRGVTFKAFQNIPATVPALMAAGMAQHADGTADYLLYEGERWTFGAFCDEVRRVANVLHTKFGVAKGDRVAIAMRNYPELMTLVLAISATGATVVFVNAWWTTEELDYALGDSGAKLVFADGPRIERLLPLVDDMSLSLVGVRDGEGMVDLSYSALQTSASDTPLDVVIDTDDDFAVMYSSGTTGHPKGVVQTHRSAVSAVFSWLMQAVMAPLVTPPAPGAPAPLRPSALVATPLFHVTATHPLFLLSLPAGAHITLMRKWDAADAVRLIQEEKITRFLGVPTQSAELMMAARDAGVTLDTLDYLGSGGAKRPAAQVAQLADTFPNAGIATGWGMTETNALGIGMIGDDYVNRPESAGKLHPPLQELRLLDDAGNDVPLGALGEITVKSPANMRCYLNKPEATAETLQDGWLRTGDLAVMDAEGYVTILDRKKNIIIRGGENIACLDVEGALHRLPDVIEACAFSVPDDRLGEVVGACVQLRTGASLSDAEMAAALDGHLAKFKIPVHLWTQHTALLRGATDKLDRRGVRAACLEKIEATT